MSDLVERLRDQHLSMTRNEAADTITALIAENERLREAMNALEGILEPFSDDPCRYDHHGYCQSHFIQPKADCCVAIARATLRKLKG